MCEFVSFNVLDNDYVKEKYNGTKNNRLEDITDVEEDEQFKDVNESDPSIKEEEIISLIEKRLKAKKEKNYERADSIRKFLKDKGIELVDQSPNETKWIKN